MELRITHKSPFVNSNSDKLEILPFNTKYTTPKVDNNIPNVWIRVILVFKIKKEKTKIRIGIIELINKAFVAVVVCRAMYKKVLKQVIPIRAKKEISIKFFLNNLINFFILTIKKIGSKKINTNDHLKNANSTGSILELTNLPRIKLPDQKSTQSTNKI